MMTREQWDSMSPDSQFDYRELLELIIQDYMLQMGETYNAISGFQELGSGYAIMVDAIANRDQDAYVAAKAREGGTE